MSKLDNFMNKLFKGEKKEQNDGEASSEKNEKPNQSQGSKKFQKPKNFKKNPRSKNFKKNQTFSSNQGANKQAKSPAKSNKKPPEILRGKLKIIPLGGLDEVGKNMTVLEYEDDIIIVDMGFEFPSEDMLGIDYVIPDISYLEERKNRIRGVVLTHGHLDHIGGIPYMMPKLNFPPIFGTRLTLGLVEKRSAEFKQQKVTRFNVINPDQTLKLGKFTLEFYRVMHSIPDCVGIKVTTPVGKVILSGDFKFDDTPARNIQPADIHKMEKFKDENILAFLCESTNALKPGHSMSEKKVGEALEEIVASAKDRIILASFSSQVGRLQQVIDAAAKHDRKIFVSGRSMRDTIDIAFKLGYLKLKPDQVQDIRKYKGKNRPLDRKTLILTTGSQGEPVSALTRMSSGEHPHVKVKKGDTIVFSSSPIIGNERAIHTVINRLTILGAKVIHNQMMDVHTSGHGKQDELARMINYVKPKYLIPIHGEYYMRNGLVDLAVERCGMQEENCLMVQNGGVLLMDGQKVYHSKEKVETKYILIDGKGEGHVGADVLVDREIMAQNGAVIVIIHVNKNTRKLQNNPEVVSKGFIYMHESREIIHEISQLAAKSYKKLMDKDPKARTYHIENYIRQTIDRMTHKKIERRPLVVPVIVEV